MIGNADPSGTARLDKSAARVHVFPGFCRRSDGKFHAHKKWTGHWGIDRTRPGGLCERDSDRDLAPDPQDYPRSRDALKAIRSEGCGLIVWSNKNGTELAAVCVPRKDSLTTADTLKTPELAEVHAVFQARTRTAWRAGGGIAVYTYGRMNL